MNQAADKRIDAAIDALPSELADAASRWFERLTEQHDVASLAPGHIEALARVIACSEFAGGVVLRDWEWLCESAESFAGEPAASPGIAGPDSGSPADVDEIKASLRCIRNRTMLRILWREICGLADLDETLEELSGLADSMLDVAMRHACRLLEPRYGLVRDAAGQTVPLVVLGMGKLGGRELNFSSDVDLIFLYTGDGESDGSKCISAQESFGRLSRQVVALLDEVTVDGFVFRIDTRLRPFGDSGPPVVSFAALESYLLQHGRDWERYAYVKARIVGTRPDDAVIDELYDDLIRPFVYRRYLDYGVFESLREMHAMIAAEVQRRELKDNIKLGPGGIREAEFVVQSLQLVRGGSDPNLQLRELQQVLPHLVSSRGLSQEGALALRKAYRFLRRLENFIQGIRDRQTHELPGDEMDRARLCLAMGYPTWTALEDDLEMHRAAISQQFDEVAFREHSEETPLQQRYARAWESGAGEAQWCGLLGESGSDNAPAVAKRLAEFAESPLTQQIDAVARTRLKRFVPELLVEVMKSPRPGIAISRTLLVLERILRRSAYIALLNENRAALIRLVDLCARSQYITDQIARFPVLLDELLDPRVFSGEVTKDELAAELDQRLGIEEAADSESRIQVISQYQRATMFRIAVADFNGSLPIMKVSDGLTWLAETVLDEALRVAWQDLATRHGHPCYVVDGIRHEAGFGIVGYGKLGGLELSYGSDLDIVFLHDSRGSEQVTDGEKPLDNSMFYGRLVRRLVHFLTTQTGSGALYEVDTRLRPDGHKGLLVSSTEAFERYQEDNAWTWEHQALLRARPVAGSVGIAREFGRIRRDTLVNRVRRDTLRDDVVSMRQRMRKELDRSNADHFDLKHGPGGIGDIEFLVQYLVLENAERYPDVIYYSDNIRQLDALVEAGCIDKATGSELQDHYRMYRLRQHHLVLDERTPLVGTEEFLNERRSVAATWDRWLA